MSTIRDIARIAGVSTATVSMVLNDKQGISQETRERVLDVAESVNYVPSAAARSLKTKRSYTLGMIIGQLSNSYSTEIITAAEKVARERGYTIFILNAELSIEKAIGSLRTLDFHNVDGILVSMFTYPERAYVEELHRLMNKGTQIVSLTRSLQGYSIPVVSYNEDEEVEEALLELIRLGHKEIGLVGAPKGTLMNAYRYNTYNRILRNHGLFREENIIYSQLDMYQAEYDTMRLLKRNPNITAIYAINDMLAIGALQAASKLGLQVPKDLSILGSDGIPYVSFTNPNITTIKTPRYEIGEIGAKKLIDLVEDIDESESVILFPCSIAKGASVAAPRSVI